MVSIPLVPGRISRAPGSISTGSLLVRVPGVTQPEPAGSCWDLLGINRTWPPPTSPTPPLIAPNTSQPSAFCHPIPYSQRLVCLLAGSLTAQRRQYHIWASGLLKASPSHIGLSFHIPIPVSREFRVQYSPTVKNITRE